MNKPNMEDLLRSPNKLKKFQKEVSRSVDQKKLVEKWKKTKIWKEMEDFEKSGKLVSAVDAGEEE